MHIPVPFTCLYAANYVPRRAQKPRVGYFRADEHLAIEKIEPSEAECAFRIRQSYRGGRRGVWNVLRHKGQLWWPLACSLVPFKQCTEELLLNELKLVRMDVFRQQRDWRWRRGDLWLPTIEEVAIRQLIESLFDSTFRDCERKAGYLLLCDGKAYMAGGEPLYGVTNYGLSILAAGPDRSADPWASWINCPVPYSDGDEAMRGSIYPATEFSEAMSALPASCRHRRKPPIEICVQDAVGASLVEIQLDALYRHVFFAVRRDNSQYRSVVFSDGLDDEEYQRLRDFVMQSANAPLGSPSFTKNRLRILKECLDREIGGQDFADALAKFFGRRDVQSIMDSWLTVAEEDAIGSLA